MKLTNDYGLNLLLVLLLAFPNVYINAFFYLNKRHLFSNPFLWCMSVTASGELIIESFE